MKERNKAFDILNLEKLIDNLTKFVEIKLELYELKIKDEIVHVISSIAVLTLILSFGLIMLFFFSLALGFYLNTLFDSTYLGFVLIGTFFLLVGIILLIFRDKLITNHLFSTFFSKTITTGKDEQNEDAPDND